MSSIVVTPENQDEFDFISKLLLKLGINARIISDEDLEDAGLAKLMSDLNRDDLTDENEIISKLNG